MWDVGKFLKNITLMTWQKKYVTMLNPLELSITFLHLLKTTFFKLNVIREKYFSYSKRAYVLHN